MKFDIFHAFIAALAAAMVVFLLALPALGEETTEGHIGVTVPTTADYDRCIAKPDECGADRLTQEEADAAAKIEPAAPTSQTDLPNND